MGAKQRKRVSKSEQERERDRERQRERERECFLLPLSRIEDLKWPLPSS